MIKRLRFFLHLLVPALSNDRIDIRPGQGDELCLLNGLLCPSLGPVVNDADYVTVTRLLAEGSAFTVRVVFVLRRLCLIGRIFLGFGLFGLPLFRFFFGLRSSQLFRALVQLPYEICQALRRHFLKSGQWQCRLRRVGAITEQLELTRYDFSPITFAASVLGVVLAGSKPSFDVNLTAFAEEPLARIGQPSERDDPI